MTVAVEIALTAATAPAIEVDLRSWEWRDAARVGAERSAANFGRSDAAHYNRERMEDDRTAQHAAAAAEIATARATNSYWTAGGAWSPEDHAQFRSLPDVGKNIEVRRVRDPGATTFAVGPNDSDRVIFACYVEPPELRRVRVLGWIRGEDALALGRDAGYGNGRVRVDISRLSREGIEGLE